MIAAAIHPTTIATRAATTTRAKRSAIASATVVLEAKPAALRRGEVAVAAFGEIHPRAFADRSLQLAVAQLVWRCDPASGAHDERVGAAWTASRSEAQRAADGVVPDAAAPPQRPAARASTARPWPRALRRRR